MSGRDDESCDIMRHHATPCDRERKRVGSGWRKTSFVRRRCGRGTRWRERKRKAGGSRKRKRKTSGHRKRKGFPLQCCPTSWTHAWNHPQSSRCRTARSRHLGLDEVVENENSFQNCRTEAMGPSVQRNVQRGYWLCY